MLKTIPWKQLYYDTEAIPSVFSFPDADRWEFHNEIVEALVGEYLEKQIKTKMTVVIYG